MDSFQWGSVFDVVNKKNRREQLPVVLVTTAGWFVALLAAGAYVYSSGLLGSRFSGLSERPLDMLLVTVPLFVIVVTAIVSAKQNSLNATDLKRVSELTKCQSALMGIDKNSFEAPPPEKKSGAPYNNSSNKTKPKPAPSARPFPSVVNANEIPRWTPEKPTRATATFDPVRPNFEGASPYSSTIRARRLGLAHSPGYFIDSQVSLQHMVSSPRFDLTTPTKSAAPESNAAATRSLQSSSTSRPPNQTTTHRHSPFTFSNDAFDRHSNDRQTSMAASAGLRADAENDEKAYKLLHKLQVDWLSSTGNSLPVASMMDEWIERLRKTLVRHLKENILKPFDGNCAKFLEIKDAQGNPVFTKSDLHYENDMAAPVNQSVFPPQQDALRANKSPFDLSLDTLVAQVNQIANIQQKNATAGQVESLVTERRRLERNFVVHRQASTTAFPKTYVLKRLRKLVDGDMHLGKFIWATGKHSFASRESFHSGNAGYLDENMPTDTEIVMTIVCHWFDNILRIDAQQGQEQQSVFFKHHVRNSATDDIKQLCAQRWWGIFDNGHRLDGSSLHHQTSSASFIPHYKVVVHGEVWDVRSGRSNMFHAVLLFLYSLKQQGISNGIDAVDEIVA